MASHALDNDHTTGTLRLTMGLDGLKEGVRFLVVALGLIIVADSAIGPGSMDEQLEGCRTLHWAPHWSRSQRW